MDYKRIIAALLIFLPFTSSFASQTRYVIEGVPHIRQGDYLCTVASCEMVLSYHKYDISQAEIAKRDIRNIEKKVEMDLEKIEMYLKERGIRVHYRAGDLERIKDYVQRDMPVILLMWTDFDKKDKRARVAIGFDDKKKTIILIDPADAKEHEIGYGPFLKLWDVEEKKILLIYPQ